MAENTIPAHPSISTLRLTTANEMLYDGQATEVGWPGLPATGRGSLAA